MPVRYDLYGFRNLSLEEARSIVAAAIGQPLIDADSGYYGGDHFKYRLGSGQGARLYRNHDLRTGAFVRSEHADYDFLLEVSDLPEMEAIERALTASATPAVLLRSTIRPDDDETDDGQ